MPSAALFSCRWELSQADDLGRRAQGASPGVLARPCPCQEDEPRSAQVRAPRGGGRPHLEGSPLPALRPRSSPGFWQQQLPALVLPCLVPDSTFVVSQDLMLQQRGAERAFCEAGGLALAATGLRALLAAVAKGLPIIKR